MTSRVVLFWALALVVAVMPGCGDGPDARFVLNKKTMDLEKEARLPVEQALKANFGTPNRLVAWERLPVDFGGIAGTVVEPAADGDNSAFKVEFKDQEAATIGFTEFTWTTGKNVGAIDRPLTVRDYDAENGVITLAETLPEPPAKGDTFVLNAGQTLKDGRRAYMINCEHCHGVSGDGDGPTARYLSPLPRDYRLGVFKFTSTVPRGRPGDKVRRDDLTRIIHNGIPGTYMPSFSLMDDKELAAIVEYIRWLSMRGEFENKLNADLLSSYSKEAVKERTGGDQPETKEQVFANINNEVAESVERGSNEIAEAWQQSEKDESVVLPTKKRMSAEEDPDSIARGRAVYLSAKAKCVTCHGVTGRGDGANTESVQAGKTEPGLFDDWGAEIKPRDLTSGIYRGGRRPIDIYRRIRSGIKGTPMPPFGSDLLTDDEVWDLVNYVLEIPHEANGTSGRDKKSNEPPAEAHASH